MNEGRISLRAAINAKCRDCIYDPTVKGRWLSQVAVCSVTSCPLWPVRPAPKELDVPRNPETVDPEWLRRGHEEAIDALRPDTPITSV